MRRFPHPLMLMLAGLHAYVGWRLLPALQAAAGGHAWVLLLGDLYLAASVVLMPLGMQARRIADQRVADGVAWLGLIAMALFSSLAVLTLLRDGVLLASWPLLPRPDRLLLAQSSAVLVVALTLLCTAVGFWLARRPRITEVSVPIRRLPPALRGFVIAQISDVHVGPTIKRGFVSAVVDRVNRLEPDMVAVTGDMVDGSVEHLGVHMAPLAELRSRHGSFFVTGNHEYYSGEAAWSREMTRLGLTVLKNRHVVVDHDGAAVVIAGVTDLSAHHFNGAERSDPAAALRGAPADAGAKILLAHQPRSAPAAATAGFDLQLSGHTHGGQFWPWNLVLRCFEPFAQGLYRLQTLMLYVSRGTGYWGPPTRFGVPAEITRIRLVTA
jgi:predicted MPP superfamily phosphohydrolase